MTTLVGNVPVNYSLYVYQHSSEDIFNFCNWTAFALLFQKFPTKSRRKRGIKLSWTYTLKCAEYLNCVNVCNPCKTCKVIIFHYHLLDEKNVNNYLQSWDSTAGKLQSHQGSILLKISSAPVFKLSSSPPPFVIMICRAKFIL